jgi:chemotaxis methyl-accepting protein methylase
MMTKLLEHVRFEGRRTTSSARILGSSGQIGRHSQLAKRSEAALQADEHELIELLFSHLGLQVTDFREAPLKRRLHAVLRALRCDTVDHAIERVTRSEASAQRALAALVIGHTLPFRDVEVFRHLADSVVPQLGPVPRVWSIGCSRGLELLSVALLLDRQRADSAILRGSDCRAPGPWLGGAIVQDFIEAIPCEFVDPGRDLRAWATRKMAAIDWRVEDVFATREHYNWDLVLCRNVSIYLKPAAADRLWQLIARALAPGGFLVTGKAEHPSLPREFRRVAHCIYQHQRDVPAGKPSDPMSGGGRL